MSYSTVMTLYHGPFFYPTVGSSSLYTQMYSKVFREVECGLEQQGGEGWLPLHLSTSVNLALGSIQPVHHLVEAPMPPYFQS